MGDRISISFVFDKQDESVTLFSHWGGREFLLKVREYIESLDRKCPLESMQPLQRREPSTVMVDFIAWLASENQESIIPLTPSLDHYYLGKDDEDGDNSDNGHWVVELKTGAIIERESE